MLNRFTTALVAVTALLCASCEPAFAVTSCKASYYAHAQDGKIMANGKPFDMHRLTAAHRTLKFGTRVKVTYRGKSVVVTITDRGPAAWTGKCIDLSLATSNAIGMTRAGVGTVTMQVLR